ncbi:PD40 domain-containing protein [bacterium]|nr:PD40 domain-containing protein [candidate division CSSED10-310 bacterium]
MRIINRLSIIALVIGYACVNLPSAGAFGKNKVTYSRFHWQVHQTEHFEYYYYPEEAELIPTVIGYFETAYARISDDLGTELTGHIPVILYRTYSDFQQTNVLMEFIPGGVGGFSEPLKRRIVIPLQNSMSDLESLINHELVHSFQFEIFFQNRINRIAPIPDWVMEGSAEHFAADWDAVGRMVLRDAVISGYLPGLDRLDDFNTLPSAYIGYKISQSAVDYLQREYGNEKLRAFLWEIRKTLKSTNYFKKVVEEIFGISLEELSARWQNDLRRRIIEIERRRESIIQFEKVVSPSQEYYRRMSPVFGVGNEVIHFMEVNNDGFNVYTGAIRDPEKKPLNQCLTCDLSMRKYRQVVTDGRSLSSCLDDGRLVFIGKYENKNYLQIIDPAVGGMVQRVLIPEDAPTSPAFSPDGRYVAYSAWSGTQSDIFVYDLTLESSRNITNDSFVDRTPFWSPDGSFLVYSSERDGQFDLYVENVGSGFKQILLTAAGDEITPAWSPDGKKIVYISDLQDGILDPYIIDLETSNVRRLAAPVTGCMTPSFSIDSKNVVLSYFYKGSERIVVIPADRIPEIPEVGKDIEPLGVGGESDYTKMRDVEPTGEFPKSTQDLNAGPVRFHLVPDYAVGMISYGTGGDFVFEGGLVVSDILGDHRIELIGRKRDNANGLLAQYLYLRNRIDYGILFSQDSDYYYVYNPLIGYYQKVNWDEYWGDVVMEYPFSTYYRAELHAGYQHLEYESGISAYNGLGEKFAYIEPAFAGDTVRYKWMMGYPEIYKGWRFRLNTRIPVAVSDDLENYWNTYFDFREYMPLSERVVFAARQWGAFSHGEDPRYFGIGGFGTIRGYEYKRLVGSRVVIANAELRFPILDSIRFPGGIAFYGFRAKMFIDAAAVWSEDDNYKSKFDDPDTSEREGSLAASYGLGINFWLIGVEWHFEWARKTDFQNSSGDWFYEWSIRRSF